MLGGGAGCINLNGEFYRGQETGGMNTQTYIVPQRKVLKNFMNQLDLKRVSRFTDFTGIPDSAFCNMLAEEGRQYALYLFHGAFEGEWGAHFIPKYGNFRDSITLNNIPSGSYTLEWVDPLSGELISSEKLNCNGGQLVLKTPGYSLDISMRMLRE